MKRHFLKSIAAAAVAVTSFALPTFAAAADITGNGVVDIDDLLAVINNWG